MSDHNYFMARLLGRGIFGFFGIPFKGYGLERLRSPDEQGYILVARYSSPMDFLAFTQASSTPLCFFLEDRVREIPVLGRASQLLQSALYQPRLLPMAVYSLARQRIRSGHHLVFFPNVGEGGDPSPNIWKDGAAFFARHCERPFVPIAIDGSRTVLPADSSIPVIHPIRLLVGIPESLPPQLSSCPRRSMKPLSEYLGEKLQVLESILHQTPFPQFPLFPPPAPTLSSETVSP
jgi:1-acyl-sn-glycerol-3-phosphate acyltransferase